MLENLDYTSHEILYRGFVYLRVPFFNLVLHCSISLVKPVGRSNSIAPLATRCSQRLEQT